MHEFVFLLVEISFGFDSHFAVEGYEIHNRRCSENIILLLFLKRFKLITCFHTQRSSADLQIVFHDCERPHYDNTFVGGDQ